MSFKLTDVQYISCVKRKITLVNENEIQSDEVRLTPARATLNRFICAFSPDGKTWAVAAADNADAKNIERVDNKKPTINRFKNPPGICEFVGEIGLIEPDIVRHTFDWIKWPKSEAVPFYNEIKCH